MNYVEAQETKEFFSTFPPLTQKMYREQFEKAQQMFQNEKDYSVEELQEQASFLNDIRMRIEVGYKANKDATEREAILKGIF